MAGMNRRIVLTGDFTLSEEMAARFEDAGFTVDHVSGVLADSELVDVLQGAWGYMLGGTEFVDGPIIAQCPDLAAICFLGTGYSEWMEIESIPERINLSYTPGANAKASAELLLGLTLSLRRKITLVVEQIRTGMAPPQGYMSPGMLGAKVGIVGLGRVGEAFALMCQRAFDTDVYFWDRQPRSDVAEENGWKQVELDDLMTTCDVVAVTCAYVKPDTHHLIDERRIEFMQRDAVLVSLGRSPIIEPNALRRALHNESIGGAALDGYYLEPIPVVEDDAYRLLRFGGHNLIVTPHMGFATPESTTKTMEMALENFKNISMSREAAYPVPR